MAIKKVIINGQPKVDLTDTTATAADVTEGKKFYGADGSAIEGELKPLSKVLADTTATEDTVLAGNIFYNNKGERKIGACKPFIEGTPKSILRLLNDNGYGSCEDKSLWVTINVPEGITDFDNVNSGSSLHWGYFLGGINYTLKFPSTLETFNTNSIFSGPSCSSGLSKHIYIADMNIYYNAILNSRDYPWDSRFYDLNNNLIANFIIPEGWTTIKVDAFLDPYGYSNTANDKDFVRYSTVTLPSTITSISGELFTGNGLSVSTLVLKTSTPPDIEFGTGELSYKVLPTDICIIIPAGSKQNYLSATGWSNLDYYLIEDDTPITFTVKGNTYTIPKTMSWYDFVNSGYNVDNKFSLGQELFNNEGQQIYEIDYEDSTVYTNSTDMFNGCTVSSIGYIKPTIYE